MMVTLTITLLTRVGLLQKLDSVENWSQKYKEKKIDPPHMSSGRRVALLKGGHLFAPVVLLNNLSLFRRYVPVQQYTTAKMHI